MKITPEEFERQLRGVLRNYEMGNPQIEIFQVVATLLDSVGCNRGADILMAHIRDNDEFMESEKNWEAED